MKKLFLLLIIGLSLLISGCANKPISPHKEQTSISSLTLLNQQLSEWKGTPYQFGGMSKKGIDCSGFIVLTFRDKFGMHLPRTTRQQASLGRQVSKSQLKTGDLVFFKTSRHVRHVGIYMENGLFLHASTSQGVKTSSLENTYWRKAYWKAIRL